MAEGSKGQRDQNELTHPSRREVIRVLGGSALLGPFVWSGCFSRDPLSPDDDSGLQAQLSVQANEECPLPLILFVPGYTGAPPSQVPVTGLKDKYYQTQKNFLMARGREWLDMNNPHNKTLYRGTDNEVTLTFKRSGTQLFDSDYGAIKCNADAIAAFLGVCQRGGVAPDGSRRPVRVTIVSHSKGGQDVLHALVESNNESDLRYAGGTAGPNSVSPLHRDLWDPDNGGIVAGWVAFTSNFFEAGFPVEGGKDGGCATAKDELALPPTCQKSESSGADKCGTPPTLCSPTAGSLYSEFPKSEEVDFLKGIRPRQMARRRRVDYMHDHQNTIRALMKAVPTLSLYATYVPEYNDFKGGLDDTNLGIRREAQNANPRVGGASDGLVPARAGQLPELPEEDRWPGPSLTRKLPGDAESVRCGVDHMAPAAPTDDRAGRFWTKGFRNQKTLKYIEEVEALSSECSTEPSPEPPPEEPTTAERIEQLIGEVEQLIGDGSLSAGEANSLTSKLDGALAALDRGNMGAAANKLGAFINEVNALVNSGRLETEEGQELIDAAQAAIEAINDGT
jgi:hypothetical protein